MTTAYVIQVELPKGIRYIGQSGKLQLVPKFFLSSPTVKLYLITPRYGKTDFFYNAANHSEHTKIIAIRDLELGLRDSKADIYFYGEWLQWYEACLKAPRVKSNPNSVFKVQLASGKLLRQSGKLKFGKTWSAAGDLRRALTEMLKMNSQAFCEQHALAGAKVVEIEHEPNGIDVKKITYHNIIEFYTKSPACKKRIYDPSSDLKWAYSLARAGVAVTA